MYRYIFSLLLISYLGSDISAQENNFQSGSAFCSWKKKSGLYNPEKSFESESINPHSFDVLNYKLDLDLYTCYSSPYSHLFSGKNILHLKLILRLVQ